jgi:hypothetical protein
LSGNEKDFRRLGTIEEKQMAQAYFFLILIGQVCFCARNAHSSAV